MNPAWIFTGGCMVGALVGVGGMLVPHALHHFGRAATRDVNGTSVHTRESFEFVAQAPWEATAPLFGADRERAWAPDWNPAFLWPQPGADQPGMVFTVPHADRTAVWVNTNYDVTAGRFEYVYVLPDVVATVIGVQLSRAGAATKVAVRYERTALSGHAADIVREMARRDPQAGPEWERQINAYLAR